MIRGTAALTLVVMALPAAGPPIRYVPRLVDHEFATRSVLCKNAPTNHAVGQSNDAKLSIIEWLGPELREVQVHQLGNDVRDFNAAQNQIRRLLARRPRFLNHFSPWAEATPLATQGILGTLRYSDDRTGRFEIAGVHLCLQDSAGVFWWIRLAEVDVWP